MRDSSVDVSSLIEILFTIVSSPLHVSETFLYFVAVVLMTISAIVQLQKFLALISAQMFGDMDAPQTLELLDLIRDTFYI